jgi:hypothetical protein
MIKITTILFSLFYVSLAQASECPEIRGNYECDQIGGLVQISKNLDKDIFSIYKLTDFDFSVIADGKMRSIGLNPIEFPFHLMNRGSALSMATCSNQSLVVQLKVPHENHRVYTLKKQGEDLLISTEVQKETRELVKTKKCSLKR